MHHEKLRHCSIFLWCVALENGDFLCVPYQPLGCLVHTHILRPGVGLTPDRSADTTVVDVRGSVVRRGERREWALSALTSCGAVCITRRGKSVGSRVIVDQVRGGWLGRRPDHSDARSGWVCFCPCAPCAVLRVHNYRKPNGKSRALSPGAGCDDISSHEPTETPADGET